MMGRNSPGSLIAEILRRRRLGISGIHGSKEENVEKERRRRGVGRKIREREISSHGRRSMGTSSIDLVKTKQSNLEKASLTGGEKIKEREG